MVSERKQVFLRPPPCLSSVDRFPLGFLIDLRTKSRFLPFAFVAWDLVRTLVCTSSDNPSSCRDGFGLWLQSLIAILLTSMFFGRQSTLTFPTLNSTTSSFAFDLEVSSLLHCWPLQPIPLVFSLLEIWIMIHVQEWGITWMWFFRHFHLQFSKLNFVRKSSGKGTFSLFLPLSFYLLSYTLRLIELRLQ